MALPLDLSRAVRSRAEQVALVEAVRDAPASEQETNYLEWKGTLNLSSKKDLTKIIKAVIGFANRQPEEARRGFSGCAYLLVGVEPGTLAGLAALDAAKLESAFAPYIGPIVQWRPDYVEVDEKTVLVVTVEPPQAGDPIHSVRKSFSDGQREWLSDGDVFVRHHASTDPAKATDHDALSRRVAAGSAADQLEVDLRLMSEDPLPRLDLRKDSLERLVDERRKILMQPLPAGAHLLLPGSAPGLFGRDSRSASDYDKEVDSYAERLTKELPAVLTARYILRHAGVLRLGIANNTDRTFAGVRVELQIPDDVFVCGWQHEAERKGRNELPVSPSPLGTLNPDRFGSSIISAMELPARVRPHFIPTVTRSDGHMTVTFSDKDVRAESTAELPPIWLVPNDKTAEVIPIEWQATAHDASKRLGGILNVAVSPEYFSTSLLMSSSDESDEYD